MGEIKYYWYKPNNPQAAEDERKKEGGRENGASKQEWYTCVCFPLETKQLKLDWIHVNLKKKKTENLYFTVRLYRTLNEWLVGSELSAHSFFHSAGTVQHSNNSQHENPYSPQFQRGS